VTNKQLKTWYLHYNKEVFNNELPADTLVVYREPVRGGLAAELRHEIDTGRHHIYVKPLFKKADCYACQLVLHESIHLLLKVRGYPKRIYSGHGKLFKAEQKRIEELGVIRDLW
jgi:hypothetical protein